MSDINKDFLVKFGLIVNENVEILGTPTDPDHAITKGYLEGQFSNGVTLTNASLATPTVTGTLNLANSTKIAADYSSPSASPFFQGTNGTVTRMRVLAPTAGGTAGLALYGNNTMQNSPMVLGFTTNSTGTPSIYWGTTDASGTGVSPTIGKKLVFGGAATGSYANVVAASTLTDWTTNADSLTLVRRDYVDSQISTTASTAAAATAAINASNIGASGTGLFKQKSGSTLQFKNIIAGSDIALVEDTTNGTVTISATGAALQSDGANLGTGTGVYATKSAATLQFKSLKAGANVSISSTTTDITISSTSAISSVNGYSTGAVTLTSSDITEGSRLFYTDARARASVSATGSLAYNSATGVFSYTTPNTDGIAEGASNLYFTQARARGAISLTSGNTGATYNNTTGVLDVSNMVIVNLHCPWYADGTVTKSGLSITDQNGTVRTMTAGDRILVAGGGTVANHGVYQAQSSAWTAVKLVGAMTVGDRYTTNDFKSSSTAVYVVGTNGGNTAYDLERVDSSSLGSVTPSAVVLGNRASVDAPVNIGGSTGASFRSVHVGSSIDGDGNSDVSHHGNNVFIGHHVDGSGTTFNTVGIGNDITMRSDAVVIGKGATTAPAPNTVGENVIIGSGAYSDSYGVAVGKGAVTSHGVVIGNTASVSTTATADQSVVIGNSAVANTTLADNGAIAIGSAATITGDGIAIGKAANAVANGTAIGSGSFTTAAGVAIGKGANVASGIAIGNGATTTSGISIGAPDTNGGVAIGAASLRSSHVNLNGINMFKEGGTTADAVAVNRFCPIGLNTVNYYEVDVVAKISTANFAAWKVTFYATMTAGGTCTIVGTPSITRTVEVGTPQSWGVTVSTATSVTTMPVIRTSGVATSTVTWGITGRWNAV